MKFWFLLNPKPEGDSPRLPGTRNPGPSGQNAGTQERAHEMTVKSAHAHTGWRHQDPEVHGNSHHPSGPRQPGNLVDRAYSVWQAPKEVHVLIPRNCEYVPLCDRDFAGGIKLRILRWAEYSGLSEYNHNVLIRQRQRGFDY